MADPPTIIDLSKDNQASHQALDTTLRKLIAINQDFAENLAHQAVGEIEKLWPDLKAERFASQDIVELSTTLRSAKINLEFRMLRALLVLWKDHLMKRPGLSSQQMIEIAVVINRLVPLQLGPAEKQNSAIDFLAADVANASKVDDDPYRLYTGDYYIDHFEGKWPSTLYRIFGSYPFSWGPEISWEKGREEFQKLWPDLEDKLIPTAQQLKTMGGAIRAAHIYLELRLLRAFVVCWMTDLPEHSNFEERDRAERIYKMTLAQMGSKNMVMHNDGGITILRREDEQNYNSAEDSELEDEEREKARRHRLVTEDLYPRNRPAPEKKRKRSSST